MEVLFSSQSETCCNSLWNSGFCGFVLLGACIFNYRKLFVIGSFSSNTYLALKKKSDSQSSRPGALCLSLAPLPPNIWTQTRSVNVWVRAEELGDSEPAGGTNPAPLASIAPLISAICSAAFFPRPAGDDGAEERPLQGREKAPGDLLYLLCAAPG